jgi:hypothetical protein
MKHTKRGACVALALLALISTTIISCDNSEDGIKSSLNGTWRYYGYYDAETNTTAPDGDECYVETLEFKKTGKAIYQADNCGQDQETEEFSWAPYGPGSNAISIVYSDGDTDQLYYHLSANRDTLTIQDIQVSLSGEVYIRQ